MAPISYAISAHNEHVELERLLDFLNDHIRSEDEIVLQLDTTATPEVRRVADKYNVGARYEYHRVYFGLNGNFAAFKNNLKDHCSRPWIFNLDADEMVSEWFIQNLPQILHDNPTVELFCVPRINTVQGLTQEHIQKWRWNVNDKGWVNFPDVQTRILQNIPRIGWAGKVHEVITGQANHAVLPLEEEYCILHHKDITRQEIQNNLYSLL